MKNYRSLGAPTDFAFDTQGAIQPVLEALTKPPLRAIRNAKFDVTRVHGDFEGALQLSLGLDRKAKILPLSFQFDGASENISLDGTFGPYALSQGRAHVQVNEKALSI